MSARVVGPIGPLRGRMRLPGDKSISHRGLIFGALATGPSQLRGLLGAEDVAATAAALRSFGAVIETDGALTQVVPPSGGLHEPEQVIDCGNSGTTMRLLSGVVSGLSVHTVLTGDASLRGRPMLRVVAPLRRMGAQIDGRFEGERAPLSIRGGDLRMTHHDLKIASAQVKTCLLLAGLRNGVAVREPRTSRDHTERMLVAMGAPLQTTSDRWHVLLPGAQLAPVDIEVPGDLSAAAFFLAAAVLVPGSEVYLERVGVNPSRSGVLDVLAAMGADVQVFPVSSEGPEPIADLLVRHGPLVGTRIDGELAVRSLDELPMIAVLAAFAEGTTVIADASELRVKESDRIHRVVLGLRSLGVPVEETPDGMMIEGGATLQAGEVDATGDHRLAMAFAVAGLAYQPVTLQGADSVASSYPGFFDDLEALRG